MVAWPALVGARLDGQVVLKLTNSEWFPSAMLVLFINAFAMQAGNVNGS